MPPLLRQRCQRRVSGLSGPNLCQFSHRSRNFLADPNECRGRWSVVVLDANEVTRLLDMASCIRAVEAAFRARGEGKAAPSATLGFPLDGGSLHVKVASL